RIVHHASFLDAAAIDELVAARDDVWVCPGLHYLRQMVDGRAEAYGITGDNVERALYPEELEASREGLAELHRRGVRLVAGGDFGHQWTQHGTYAAELVAYVELLGLTAHEALLTATANAGPLVDLPLGKVEAGYLADLVVVGGDPTEDVRVLLDPSLIGGVVKGGQPISGVGWGEIERWTSTSADRSPAR
ncbi:MAG TPA: amidohydrolase family protein, partial [Microthrixaceae bacterium]|nr:amidohydrolase family protein [Microthrixaceae bacterium]